MAACKSTRSGGNSSNHQHASRSRLDLFSLGELRDFFAGPTGQWAVAGLLRTGLVSGAQLETPRRSEIQYVLGQLIAPHLGRVSRMLDFFGLRNSLGRPIVGGGVGQLRGGTRTLVERRDFRANCFRGMAKLEMRPLPPGSMRQRLRFLGWHKSSASGSAARWCQLQAMSLGRAQA